MAKIKFSSRYLSSIKSGEIEAKWNAANTRILRYMIDFWQNDLGLHKQVSAPEIYLLEIKVQELLIRWDKMADDHFHKSRLAASKEACDALTIEAVSKLESLRKILVKTLTVDDRVDWETLKDKLPYHGNANFPELAPKQVTTAKPIYMEPVIGFWEGLFGKRAAKLEDARRHYELKVHEWEKIQGDNLRRHQEALTQWNNRKSNFKLEYETAKAAFLAEQLAQNSSIDELALSVKTGDVRSVIEHASLVLDASDYEGLFEKSYEIDYQANPKLLLVEYDLPSPNVMPTLKSVRFTASTGEVKETYISDKEQRSNFDLACYQIVLRTLHELFEADESGNLDAVLFNGFSTAINPANGKNTRSCIMSLLARKTEFLEIDLSRVDPKSCFKSLKGVSASSLAALAPIAPVMEMNKQDKRFVDAREVISAIDTATNLASMDWSDFEHLIRELFEKEFASRGGDVKITQASSDGGVDAVAFDPDPITGGKIVIQAKRYTRTVGVSAVRDLFGTVQHEGASRGILISTADYGPDAHQFAAGKPISLFSGSHLLHLMEKHGYNAKIDLQAARKELNLK
ncbi:restriction endonuclease [Agrobacterium sp. Azo12]|uniref:restriction endonuclease n=1 Tax=Agrobacterium sp. Azo12 TaxID=3031129 RepID=UPI0023D87FF0|nr:restriction endonuclease [Agrobacterium sp. Azo12]MDO5897861.1 restriction endonuclease [Agrobacterium sp. Azo12]